MNRPLRGNRSPEERAAKRREREETRLKRQEVELERRRRKLEADKVTPLALAFTAHQSCGVLALQGASIDQLVTSLDYIFAGHGMTKKLNAEGNTQGADRTSEDPYQVESDGMDIDQFVNEAGYKGLLIVKNTRFSKNAGEGTPDIAGRLSDLAIPDLSARSGRYPKHAPSLVMLGSAEGVDLSGIALFNDGKSEIGVAGQLGAYLMLHPGGELSPLSAQHHLRRY